MYRNVDVYIGLLYLLKILVNYDLGTASMVDKSMGDLSKSNYVLDTASLLDTCASDTLLVSFCKIQPA